MQRFCSSCGRERNPGHRYCPQCGAPDDVSEGDEATVASGQELHGRALTATAVGIVVGLVVSSAIVWFFLADGGSTEVAATSANVPEQGEQGPQHTLSIGTESEQAVDSERASGRALATSTTAGTVFAADSAPDVNPVDVYCPQTANVDNRSMQADSLVIEEWSNEDTIVRLCRADDGMLSYFGQSDRGSIFLDAERSADGFSARNRDTSYVMSDGVLSVKYPGETVTYELKRID